VCVCVCIFFCGAEFVLTFFKQLFYFFFLCIICVLHRHGQLPANTDTLKKHLLLLFDRLEKGGKLQLPSATGGSASASASASTAAAAAASSTSKVGGSGSSKQASDDAKGYRK
jgi:hypothetical protein